ncbi:MAG: ABC transporter permease subunit [Lachnospiraceae bacterium]|nr:ABC transporter permease subunit [Lachnospiraceae bacterium]
MNKLIRAGFKRALRIKSLYICLAVLFFIDGLDIIKESIFPEPGRSLPEPEGYLVSAFLTMILLAAVFITSFLGSEHQYGTLRNKIAVGHERWKLYVSSFIVCYSAVMIMYVFTWVMTAVLGTLLLGGFKSSAKELFDMILISFLAFTMLTSLFVTAGLCIHSKSMSSVAAVIAAFLCMFAGVMTVQVLSTPEFIPAESIPAQLISEYEPAPGDPTLVINPDYVSGQRRKTYEAVHKLCPASQILTADAGVDTERVLIPLAETVILFAAGMLIFKKRDLK